MNGRIGSILARCFIHSVKYPTWEGRKVGRNGNWVMSAKVVGGEGPGGTRLESIEASRWKKEVFFRSPLRHRWLFSLSFSACVGWTSGENARRGRVGKMWNTLTLEQGSRREDIEPTSPEAELPHQVSMETWHSLSGFSSFSSCSSFSSLLCLFFLSLSLSILPFSSFSLSPHRHRHRRIGLASKEPYFPLFSSNRREKLFGFAETDLAVSISKFYLVAMLLFFFFFLRYFLGSSWITSTFRTPSTDHPMKNEIHRRGNNLSAWVE